MASKTSDHYWTIRNGLGWGVRNTYPQRVATGIEEESRRTAFLDVLDKDNVIEDADEVLRIASSMYEMAESLTVSNDSDQNDKAWAMTTACCKMADGLLAKGQVNEAGSYLDSAMIHARKITSSDDFAAIRLRTFVFVRVADLAMARGDHVSATDNLTVAAVMYESLWLRHHLAECAISAIKTWFDIAKILRGHDEQTRHAWKQAFDVAETLANWDQRYKVIKWEIQAGRGKDDIVLPLVDTQPSLEIIDIPPTPEVF